MSTLENHLRWQWLYTCKWLTKTICCRSRHILLKPTAALNWSCCKHLHTSVTVSLFTADSTVRLFRIVIQQHKWRQNAQLTTKGSHILTYQLAIIWITWNRHCLQAYTLNTNVVRFGVSVKDQMQRFFICWSKLLHVCL